MDLLTVEWLLSQFGANVAEATGEYRRFVRQGRGVEIWDELRGGILLGSDSFVLEMTPRLHETQDIQEIPRKQRFATRPSLDEVFSGVRTKTERNQKIYEAARRYEYTLAELQEYLGLHYSTISRIASHVDEERISKGKI